MSVWKTRAAFRIAADMGDGTRRLGGWRWFTWTHGHGNKHAAIIEKARELGACAWDFGQADHEEASRAGF